MTAQEGEFIDAKAMIVDASSSARHGMQLALNHLGVKKVVAVSRVADARRQLAQRAFDIILCDYRFEHGANGHEFFQSLRLARALPLSTIFIMVTNEAAASSVADVAESAPDDYLLKPINANLLEERLRQAKRKKIALAPLHAAYEHDDHAQLIELGEALLRDIRFPYRTDVTRLMATAHVALEQTDQAIALYDHVLQAKAIPWARLGMRYDKDNLAQASPGDSALRNLVSESASYVDAYDKLARLRAKEGRFQDALGVYERALRVTPDNVGRLQVAGQLAFCVGRAEQSVELLERALARSADPAGLDLRTLVHLAMAHMDNSNAEGADRMAQILSAARKREPEDFRTQLLAQLATICAHMARRRITPAVNDMRQVGVLGIDERLTFELACDLLAVLDRMYARDVHTDVDYWTAQLVRRFSVSAQSNALMLDFLRLSPELTQVARENGASIQVMANEGMELLVAGKAREAAQRLLENGEDTFNARLLAIACSAGAHATTQAGDESSARIAARAYELIQRFGEGGLHLPYDLARRVQQFALSVQNAQPSEAPAG